MLVGSIFSIKPIPGVIRPCIPTLVPKEGGLGILLDVGANADCRSDVLAQFGLLGSLLAEHVYILAPRGRNSNIGEEEKKGDLLRQSTYELMKEQTQYRFVGNVEGRDLFNDKADVMVCDGFTGNVVLKVVEGFHDLLEAHGVNDPSCTASTTRTMAACRAGCERQRDHWPRHQQRGCHQEHGDGHPGGHQPIERTHPRNPHMSRTTAASPP